MCVCSAPLLGPSQRWERQVSCAWRSRRPGPRERCLEECHLSGTGLLLVPVPARSAPLRGSVWFSLRLTGLLSPCSPPRNLDSRTFITIGDRVCAGCSLGHGLHVSKPWCLHLTVGQADPVGPLGGSCGCRTELGFGDEPRFPDAACVTLGLPSRMGTVALGPTPGNLRSIRTSDNLGSRD